MNVNYKISGWIKNLRKIQITDYQIGQALIVASGIAVIVIFLLAIFGGE